MVTSSRPTVAIRLLLVLALGIASVSFATAPAAADPADTEYAREMNASRQRGLKNALIKQITDQMKSKTYTGHQWNKFMSAGNLDTFVRMIQQVDNIVINPRITDRYVTSFWGTDEISLSSDPRKGGGNPETTLHELLHRIQHVNGDDQYLANQPGLTFSGPDNTLQKQYDERYTDYLESMRGKFIYLNRLEQLAANGASVESLKTAWERFEAEYAAAIGASRKYFGIDPKLMRTWCGFWFPDPATIAEEYLAAKLPTGKGWTNLKTMLRTQKASNKYTVQLTAIPSGCTEFPSNSSYPRRNVVGSNPYVFDYIKEPWPKGAWGFSEDQEAYLGFDKGSGETWVSGSVTVKYRKGSAFPRESGYTYSSTLIDGTAAEIATVRGGGVPGAAEGDVTTSILLRLPSGDGVSIRAGARSVIVGNNGGPAAQERAAPINAAIVNNIRVKKGTVGATSVSSTSANASPREAAYSAMADVTAMAGMMRSAPDVSGDQVVWEEYTAGSWDIYGQKLGGYPTKLSIRAGDQRGPRISGNTVVWYEESGTNADVWAYDIPSGKSARITDHPSPQYEPAIAGNRIVWSDYRNGNWDIYTYDTNNGAIERLTADTRAQRRPQISQIPGVPLTGANTEYRIIWRDERKGKADIYLHDMRTGSTRRLTSMSANENDPAIDGDLVVWKDTGNGLRGDIHCLDLRTGKTTIITSDSYSQNSPDVANGRITWSDNRNGDGDIYVYTVASRTLQRITPDPAENDSPRIGATWVVWRETGAAGSNIGVAPIGGAVKLTKPRAPRSVRAKASFAATGAVMPAHTGSVRDIRIVVRKWNASKKTWAYYGSVWATSSAGPGNTLGYAARFSLDRRGLYALQAVHPGCTRAGYGTSGNTSAGWAQVQVK
ncbi:MAG: hypothetical protein U1E26_10735 [Coriobacteriia bacterium]|nr:hypothetical protein [Coriobacteriia bacterium]